MRIDPVLFAVSIGFWLDFLFGDPKLFCHPVILIGRGISFLEKRIRRHLPETGKWLRIGGGILTCCILLFFVLIPFFLLMAVYRIHFYAGMLLETFFCFRLLAYRSMQRAAMDVYRELNHGDLDLARTAVGRIVGRDTNRLSREGVIKATVESVAESTSDGVIAPLFYMCLLGAVGGFFYKSINTMDSMIGYQNDTYRYFGSAAARLDDIVNFIPARLTGILLVLSAYILGKDGKHAWRIFCRDRLCHKSPNSASPESAMAGALGILLGGSSFYFGKKVRKPTIGDAKIPPEPGHIPDANRMMLCASVLGMLVLSGVRILLFWLI